MNKYETCMYLDLIFLYLFILCACVDDCAMIYLWDSEDKLHVGSLLRPGGWFQVVNLGRSSWVGLTFCQSSFSAFKRPMFQEIVLRMREHLRHLADESGGLQTLPLTPRRQCPHILLSTSVTRKTLPAQSGNSVTVPKLLLATILRVRCKMAVDKSEQRKNSMFFALSCPYLTHYCHTIFSETRKHAITMNVLNTY